MQGPAEELFRLPIEPSELKKARQRVLARSAEFDLTSSLGARIERHAAAAPDRVALVDDTESFTYAELVAEVAKVASLIRSVLANPHAIIAVSGRRSALSVIAFLAIEKAGGVYLPIDENWPELRVREILGGSGAACVIVDEAARASKSLIAAIAGLDCPLLSLAEARSAEITSQTHASGTHEVLDPTSPRYVLYTSGSTGRPKGAIVEHRGMVNHLLSKVLELQLSESDCIAQTAPLTFDVSIWQMVAALVAGGRVCVLNDEDVLSPERMIDAVASHAITVLEVVPTILSLLLEEHERRVSSDLERLRFLVATGEALPPSTARRWISAFPSVPLVNAYGPTECSDDVTHEVVSLPEAGQIHVPIGVPIPNARLYLLVEDDGVFRSCDENEPGELFVGGICVGRGYVGDRDRTRAAFFRDPFVGDEDARLYRTGDLVRLTPSGSLEYLGRIDRQVKVGGVRIELGEIEEVLRGHAAVSDAAVVVLAGSETGRLGADDAGSAGYVPARLVAFVTGRDLDPPKLKAFLSERLPRPMVPSELLVLAALPLTPNKKIDYRELETTARDKHEYGLFGRPCAVMYAHEALVAPLSEMRREGADAGSRSLHVGASADVALHAMLELASGITQVFPERSSAPTSGDVYEQCRAYDVSLLRLSAAVPGALSSDEASWLRRHVRCVRVDHRHVDESARLLGDLAGDHESPSVEVHYGAEAAIAVSRYSISSEHPRWSE